MKKRFTLVLVGALALSLAACGTQTNGASASAPAGAEKKETDTAYFGKIAAVAGNEIELNLAKEPELPEQPEGGPKDEDGTVEAMEMTPALPAGTMGENGAANRTEVEYTGEMKSFCIPSGMPVKDAAGNEKQLSDIKKGSIMNIFVDENGAVTAVFLYA